MGDETPTEQSLDQQLEALFKTDSPTPQGDKSDGSNKASDKPGPAASPDPAKPAEAEKTDDPLEKALEDIKEDEKPEEKAPQLSEDQQAVLAAIPSAEVATKLYGVVENYQNFTRAFENKDFDSVDAMFENWNKPAYEDFLDHIYQKHMVKGDWAERFIAEAEGRGTEQKGMKQLRQELNNLKSKLEQKDQGTVQEQQKAENVRVAQAYENYANGLFDQINFSKADRRWVMADLNTRVGSDPKAMQAVRSGNLAAIHGMFKAAVREYVNRDKQVTSETDKKIDLQSQKKPLAAGGVGAPTDGELPSDIRQVAKGQEDNWMMQELGKLAKKVGLKKS